MRPRVDGQGTALDEALIATWDCALIRALVGVDAIMSAQVGFAIERLSASFPGTIEPS